MADTKWLTKRGGNAWHAIVAVPRKLRPVIGKSHLLKSLQTTDLVVARARRHTALAEFNAIIDDARRHSGAESVLDAAMVWREHLRRLRQGDLASVHFSPPLELAGDDLRSFALSHAEGLIEDDAGTVAATHGVATAHTFYGVATGTATPLELHVDSWLQEGGSKGELTLRTRAQYRSAVAAFAAWCRQMNIPSTIEAISKPVAGQYVTGAFVAKSADPKTTNKHVSSLSSYWRWLIKRTAVEANPWEGQSRSKSPARNGEKTKRPFSDQELQLLLRGDADTELADAIRVAALSGMRLEEIYQLTVNHCRNEIFDIRNAKTAAGVRQVPIHSELTGIVGRRCEGKASGEYLFHEPGPDRAGRERSMSLSKRFGRYRRALGVEEREDGRRHSKVDFHSLRRWFVTKARHAGIDRAVVAAVVGHEAGNLTDDVYSGGPSMTQRRQCVEAVTLPA